MKKLFCFIVSAALCCLATVAQTQLQGQYENEDGMYFEFDKGHYKLIMPNNYLASEVLSEGVVNIVEEGWAELSYEESPLTEAFVSTQITQTYRSCNSDSIRIEFSFPYDLGKLHISVGGDYRHYYDLTYQKGKDSICTIAPNTRIISFSIKPEHYIPHTRDGEFHGLTDLCILDCDVLKGNNYIQIEIPVLDNSFFEKIYIRHEYIKINKHSIIWRGDRYVKKRQHVREATKSWLPQAE